MKIFRAMAAVFLFLVSKAAVAGVGAIRLGWRLLGLGMMALAGHGTRIRRQKPEQPEPGRWPLQAGAENTEGSGWFV